MYVFSGLPGVGKTALARRLASLLGAAYFRLDTIEQGLRDLCSLRVGGEGYRLTYRIAADNLRVGLSVVVDCCNPIALTRGEWRAAAEAAGAACVDIEIACSDEAEHRRRVETRPGDIPGLELPSWSDVTARPYEPWDGGAARIDTAGRSEDECFELLMASLSS